MGNFSFLCFFFFGGEVVKQHYQDLGTRMTYCIFLNSYLCCPISTFFIYLLILKPPLILDTKKKTRTHALVFFLDQWMPHDLLQKIIPPDSTSGPIFLAQQLTCAVLIRFPFVSQVKFLLYSKQSFTKKCLDPCSCPINLCLQLMKSEKNLHLKIKFFTV